MSITSELKKHTKGTSLAPYVTKKNIKNLHREYVALMSRGIKPVVMTIKGRSYMTGKWSKHSYDVIKMLNQKLKLKKQFIDYFLRVLFGLATMGEINFKLYDPVGVEDANELKKRFSIWKKFDPLMDSFKYLLVAGVIGGGLYIYSTKKKV